MEAGAGEVARERSWRGGAQAWRGRVGRGWGWGGEEEDEEEVEEEDEEEDGREEMAEKKSDLALEKRGETRSSHCDQERDEDGRKVENQIGLRME